MRTARKNRSGTTAKMTDEGLICLTCKNQIWNGCDCYHGEGQCRRCQEWTYPFYYEVPEDGCQHCGASGTSLVVSKNGIEGEK